METTACIDLGWFIAKALCCLYKEETVIEYLVSLVALLGGYDACNTHINSISWIS